MSKPPFRADHVGSLLRPRRIAEARAAGMPAASLQMLEDAEIPALIKLQEDVGLKVVTDGEARRAYWHFDFMGMLEGMDLEVRGERVQFHGTTLPPIHPVINGKLGFPRNHPMLSHFSFVKAHTKVCPKISIPGPSCLHFRTDPADIRPAAYKDLDVLFADIAQTYKDAVSAYFAIGCRYLQLDDIFLPIFVTLNNASSARPSGRIPTG